MDGSEAMFRNEISNVLNFRVRVHADLHNQHLRDNNNTSHFILYFICWKTPTPLL